MSVAAAPVSPMSEYEAKQQRFEDTKREIREGNGRCVVRNGYVTALLPSGGYLTFPEQPISDRVWQRFYAPQSNSWCEIAGKVVMWILSFILIGILIAYTWEYYFPEHRPPGMVLSY